MTISAAMAETINPADFDHSMKITFSGYTTGETLTNFPTLIKLSGITTATAAADNGVDLRFTDSDGSNVIPYEVESWSHANGASVWVKVPELESTGTDSIYAYWGNTNVLVWDSASFNPTNLTDCQMWLKADAGVQTDGSGNITNWVDQSSGGNDAANATTTECPKLTGSALNGITTLHFDGTDDKLNFNGEILTNTDYTVFVVEGRTSAQDNNYFMRGTTTGGEAANKNMHLGYRYNSSLTHAQYSNDYDMPVDEYTSQKFNLYAFDLDSAQTRGKHTWLNGSLWGSKTNDIPLISYDGASIGGTGDYLGDIAEVIIYDRALSEVERSKVERYLAGKYELEDVTVYGNAPDYTFDGSVWSNGYTAVWHLNDNIAQADVAGSHHAANNGTVSTDGMIAGARDFSGDHNLEAYGYQGITGTVSRTCSAWIKTTGGSQPILYWGDNAAEGAKWRFRLQTENGTPNTLRVEVSGGYMVGSTVINDGQWHFVNVVLDDDGTPDVNEAKLYVDGVLEVNSAVQDEPVSTASNSYAMIGTDIYGANFGGIIDEVRIADTARSAAWIGASYMNMADNSSFITYGSMSGLGDNRYWDTDAVTGLQSGSGTWDSDSTAVWSDSTNGTSPLLTWQAGNTAIFKPAGTSTATVSGTVTANYTGSIRCGCQCRCRDCGRDIRIRRPAENGCRHAGYFRQ